MAANRASIPIRYCSLISLSSQLARGLFRGKVRRKVLSLALILSLLSLPISLMPIYQLPVMAASVVTLKDSPVRGFVNFLISLFASSQSPRRAETMDDRVARVSHIEVSPRRFVGYQGQTVIFNALPTDSASRTIQGVRFTWQSSNPDKVQIDEQGRATLLQPGLARISCRAGAIQTSVPVLVRPGHRPVQTDTQWRADQDLIDEAGNIIGQTGITYSFTDFASAMVEKLSPTAHAQIGPPSYNDLFYDEFYAEPRNLVGSPRNRAAEAARMGTVHPEGSNFTFAMPVANLGGRGVGVDLTLYYNSRVWFRRGSAITFDPVYSWPAPGCTLGFGRIITYGPASALKYVFIDRDGTRRYLGQGGTASQTVTLQTSDGTHITYVGNATTGGTLFYNNGAQVTISSINNRLLASVIQDSNGNYITVAYKGINYPPMAIDYVTDTLGRVIQFHYGTSGELGSVSVPGFGGTSQNPVSSILIQFAYQSQTISNSFSGLTVENVPTGTVKLLGDIREVATNNQYRLSYSAYGMAYNYSLRRQATYIGQQGLERAATSFNYPTGASSLTDAPSFSQRTETASSSPTSVYSYAASTDAGAQTMIFTVTRPDNSQLLLTRSTNSSSVANGLLVQAEVKSGTGASMSKSVSSFVNDPGGSPQVQSVISYDDSGTPTRVDFDYDQYGNVTNSRDYGFQVSGNWQVRRRTRYVYKTDTAYVNAYLRSLLIEQNTYDAKLNTSDGDDEMLTKSTVTYDDYAAMGGMEEYRDPQTGQLPSPPPGHATGFGASYTVRGNVTGSTQWHDLAGNLSYTRLKKYDVFGNMVKEQSACCNEQTATITQDSYWSQASSVTKGAAGGPQLTSSFGYDFNTSAVTTTTDPKSLQTDYGYDPAMRLNNLDRPTGVTVHTTYSDDGLTATTTTTYTDAGTQKVLTTTKTYDGWGRITQEVDANNGQVNTTYDAMGRVASRTNPFTAGGQAGSWTSYAYDALGRAKETTLPDTQKVTTAYNSSSVTITDQVNRKIQYQADGLGRLVTVNEQDASGALAQATTYTYDLLDNLTQVDQGGQLRKFKYDALSRKLYERIPEQQATIIDGANVWTTKFTYTDFSAVATRQDARGVITTYTYDLLNRLTQVSYNTVTPIPTAPTVNYVYDTDPVYGNSSNGEVVRVNVGSDFEERYSFDSFKRVSSKTRKLGTGFYTTSYQYNEINQLTQITYPSGRAVTIGHDSRGRVSGLTDVATSVNYTSSIGYNEAGQVTGLTLGNGVQEVYGYDLNRMQMTSQKAGTVAPYTNRMDLTYNYQAASVQNGAGSTAGNTGRLMSITGTIASTTESASYTYDLQGRLVTSNQTTNGASAQRRFTYDRFGNRTGVWDAISGGTQIQALTIDQTDSVANNRVKLASGQSYSYDAAGNLISDGAHTYTYDSENRLVAVDGTAGQYSYDHQNRRWKKATSGSTIYYVWEGSHVIAEHNGGTGAVLAEYISSGGRMVAKIEAGATQYFLNDRLSTRVVIDASGGVIGRQGHLPFGEEIGPSGANDKHKFTSYERDGESGTDYAVNRQYGQSVGRFMRVDPVAGSLSNPQSLNRFAYVGNDPINAVDPKGLFRMALLIGCHQNVDFDEEYNEDGSPNFTVGFDSGETCDVMIIDFGPFDSGDEGEPQTRCHDDLNTLEGLNSVQKGEFDLIANMAGDINPGGIEAALNDFNMLLDEFNTRFGSLSEEQRREYIDRFGAIGDRVGQLFGNADKKTKREVRDRARDALDAIEEASELADKIDERCESLFNLLPQDRVRFDKAKQEAKKNLNSYSGYYHGVILGTFRP